MRRNGAHFVSDRVGKEWRLPSNDADVGGMLALCVVKEKTEIRYMMTRRAEPERHDVAYVDSKSYIWENAKLEV